MASLKMAKSNRQRKKYYIVVGNDGDVCPRCGRPTEIREHAVITEKLLRQPSYYSRWFYCINPNCKMERIMPLKMERIMPRRYLVWNGSPLSPWDV
jgi:hypothetical protein